MKWSMLCNIERHISTDDKCTVIMYKKWTALLCYKNSHFSVKLDCIVWWAVDCCCVVYWHHWWTIISFQTRSTALQNRYIRICREWPQFFLTFRINTHTYVYIREKIVMNISFMWISFKFISHLIRKYHMHTHTEFCRYTKTHLKCTHIFVAYYWMIEQIRKVHTIAVWPKKCALTNYYYIIL